MPIGTRYTVNVIDSVDAHLAEADMISCVTGSAAPMFDGNELKQERTSTLLVIMTKTSANVTVKPWLVRLFMLIVESMY